MCYKFTPQKIKDSVENQSISMRKKGSLKVSFVSHFCHHMLATVGCMLLFLKLHKFSDFTITWAIFHAFCLHGAAVSSQVVFLVLIKFDVDVTGTSK